MRYVFKVNYNVFLLIEEICFMVFCQLHSYIVFCLYNLWSFTEYCNQRRTEHTWNLFIRVVGVHYLHTHEPKVTERVNDATFTTDVLAVGNKVVTPSMYG